MISEKKIISYILNNSQKIKINSNEVKKNDVFLALKGKKLHGNKFIDNSFSNGAKYCISDGRVDKKLRIGTYPIIQRPPALPSDRPEVVSANAPDPTFPPRRGSG